MSVYKVKSWSHFFDAIVAGDKKHDMRDMKDRDYKVGDVLVLQRFDNIKGVYTGEHVNALITYITSRNTPCAFSSAALERDYCILSLDLIGHVHHGDANVG